MQPIIPAITKLLSESPNLLAEVKTLKKRKDVVQFLSKEARHRGIALKKKEVMALLGSGSQSYYAEVPSLRVLGPSCFNSSSDSDEENGGTSCTTSC